MAENEESKSAGPGQGSPRRSRGGSRGGSGGGAGASRGGSGDTKTGRGERGGRGGRGGRGRRDRDEPREREFQETLIGVYRCSATVKGGRRLSFGSLVCVGDGKGRVGIGYGKAKEVPGAFQKAIKAGRRSLKRFFITPGGSIPHEVKGRFGASQVILIPAMPGTGVIAGTAVKAILEAGGLTNVLTKVYGSTNTRNVVKAVMDALEKLRSKEMTESLRGVAIL
ncbi:MAG: 30S ribosomal protein S5 [Planctomycetota bacterium]|jgi:small subunit ribosomal protein S5|nr:30S ribosomal protein S5 [Planctomycetota bacterium]